MEERKNTNFFFLGVIVAILFSVIGSIYIIRGSPLFLEKYQAKNIYVYDRSERKVVLAKREKEKVPPASLTKIMTSLIALENIQDLSEIAPVDKESYQKMVARNSSMAGFYGNETTTYRDLLYGTMLASGGECAKSLSIRTQGNEKKFVEKMNKKARELNLKHTHFKNVEGMDEEEHYTSAEDMGILLDKALEDGDFRAIFTRGSYASTETLDHPQGLEIESTVLSKLEGYNQNGFRILGGKSGTTQKAGLCWATLAEKKGREYIVVVMGVPLEDISNPSDEQILETLKILEKI